jgi:DNA-binding beta-propeller fold protein YncE
MLAAVVICILANLGVPAPTIAGPGFPGSPDQSMPAPSLFVALYASGAVAVLDPTTNEIRRVARFPMTYFPMVASPTKPLLFVLDGSSATQIDFINTNTIGLVGTVTTTSRITGMTLGDNGNILYAASGDQVLEISVQTRTIKAAITLPGLVFDVAVVGQGHRLYATLPDLHEFAIIDATTNTVRGFVPAGRCDHRTGHDPCYPRDIRTSPGGRYAIAVSGHNAIAVDTLTGTVLASPAVETFLFYDYALAVDPSSNEL